MTEGKDSGTALHCGGGGEGPFLQWRNAWEKTW